MYAVFNRDYSSAGISMGSVQVIHTSIICSLNKHPIAGLQYVWEDYNTSTVYYVVIIRCR